MQNLIYKHEYHRTWHQRKQTAVSIRRATLADAPIIARMGTRLVAAAHAKALSAADMKQYLKQAFNLAQVKHEIHQPHSRFFLAEKPRNVVGMVKIEPSSPGIDGAGQNPVELSRLYLQPDWIGKGVGAALMQHALNQAAEAQHDTCWLMVWAGNQRALEFYKRWQFTIAEKIDYPVGKSNLPAYLMLHKISA